MIIVERYHDISCGHRVYQHESCCASLHGHNYRIYFRIQGKKLDALGRVIDFSVIKRRLCTWLEEHWDHKFLLWEEDPWLEQLAAIDRDGVRAVPFNPTAENMAQYLLYNMGPQQLSDTEVELISVRVQETAKCSAEVHL